MFLGWDLGSLCSALCVTVQSVVPSILDHAHLSLWLWRSGLGLS